MPCWVCFRIERIGQNQTELKKVDAQTDADADADSDFDQVVYAEASLH